MKTWRFLCGTIVSPSGLWSVERSPWLWQGGYVITKMALELFLDPPQTEVENPAGGGRGYALLGSAIPGWPLRAQRAKDYKH